MPPEVLPLMRFAPRRPVAAALVLAFAVAGLASCQQQDLPDGLYARFVTPKGTIVASLAYDKAPLTVGNFVGLAEGKLDAAKGKRFYDGLTFHRVEPGFVIQGGDPQGNGSGGPGYRFPDEFSPELRHDGAGILSMANSGEHTNGSQFFITLGKTEWLDDRHSVFGKVVSGLDVAEKIQAGDAMTKVEIVRVGAAAKAFKADQKAWDERLSGAWNAIRAANAARAEADIAAIAAKWPDMVRDADGIFGKVLRKGFGEPPAAGSTVAVIYKGSLLDGTVFDQSALSGGPFRFRVGVGEVIPGWDKVVATMRKGEKRLVVIPPELAYGASGAGGVIPPNAFLVFEMELTSISK